MTDIDEEIEEIKKIDLTQKSFNCKYEKKVERDDKEIKTLISRLNRIEGQVRGIKKMVEDGVYCPEILIQSSAVSAAMNSFNRELMKRHVKHCVVNDVRAGNDDTIIELLAVLEKLMK